MERINPRGVHAPGPYSHVVRAGNTVYIAGQVAIAPTGQLVGVGDAAAQTHQVFTNLMTCLKSQGLGPSQVAKLTTFVVGRENLEAVRSVRKDYFPPGAAPASTMVLVVGLAHPDMLVEVEAIAVRD